MNAWFASWGVPRLEKQGVVLVLLACTSVSLRFLGQRGAVRGRLGKVSLHLLEECRTGRDVLRMFEMFGRPR